MHQFNMSWKDFYKKSLNQPGTLVEIKHKKIKEKFLIVSVEFVMIVLLFQVMLLW